MKGFCVAGLLALLSIGAWAAPRLEKAYFQTLGSHLLSEAFKLAGQSGRETFACAHVMTLDKKTLQLAQQALDALGKAGTQQAYLLQGRAYCLLGEAAQAAAAYRQFVVARQKNPLGYLELGFAYEREMKPEMAKQSWDRANINADQFWVEGKKAYEAGRADDALQWLNRAITLRPDWDRPHFTKGLVYASQGKTEQAANDLRTALSFNPGDPEIYLHLGEVLASAQDYSAALAAYNNATEAGPFVIQAWLKIAETDAKQKNVSAALAAYQKAVEKSVLVDSSEADWVWKRVWPSNALGSYLIDIGEFDQAVMYFMKALDLDQGRQYAAFSYWNLGRIALQKVQYKKAQEYLQQALQLQPNDYIKSQVYLVYAQIDLALGNTLEGIDYLRKALIEDPENQGLNLLLAETIQKAGFLEDALKEYELYLAKWPGDTYVQEVIQELKNALQSQAPFTPS